MDLTDRARRLRRNMTDAETILWSRLRDRQLAGYKFRRQVQIGPYIADFLCHEAQLIVELDGEQHGEDTAVAYDQKRTEQIRRTGYRVWRFGNHEVKKDLNRVLDEIVRAIEHGSEQE